jgi:hypothetical protein
MLYIPGLAREAFGCPPYAMRSEIDGMKTSVLGAIPTGALAFYPVDARQVGDIRNALAKSAKIVSERQDQLIREGRLTNLVWTADERGVTALMYAAAAGRRAGDAGAACVRLLLRHDPVPQVRLVVQPRHSWTRDVRGCL